jgi:hypothetical protein
MKTIDEISQKLTGLSFEEADRALALFDSYSRTTAMMLVMSRAPSPRDCLTTFLNWGNACDAPWPHRSHIADLLRWACGETSLTDLLTPDARKFHEALPSLIQVWRGCERGRVRQAQRVVARRGLDRMLSIALSAKTIRPAIDNSFYAGPLAAPLMA